MVKFLLASVLAIGALQAAPACHRPQPAATIQARVFTAFLEAVGVPLTFTSSSARKCAHMEEVERWKQWRQRNPKAHSRYQKANRVSVLSFGSSGEPEPDPGGLGCGCDLATAMASDGCGWFHSQIYGLRR